MKIKYLTNIKDPIWESAYKYKRKIPSVLVSEKYVRAFINGKYSADDFDFLLSDNGNFTRLNMIARKYKKEAELLEEQALQYSQKELPIPAVLRAARRALNKRILADCKEMGTKNDFGKITSNQVAIRPHAIIGAEDTVIPILQICGAFHPFFIKEAPSLLQFQRKTVQLYQQQYNGAFGEKKALKQVRKYIVLHAIDHDSVVKAVKNLSKVKFDAVAISLGGPLELKSYIKSTKINGKEVVFSEALPESYVLSILLLMALRDNLPKNKPIHILGLGSPILVLLAGYLFKNLKLVTIDSTATYKDMEVNCIYGNKGGLKKMNLFKLAAYCIVNNVPFKGISPYFPSFESMYPSNWKKLALRFEKILSDRTITKSDKVKKIRDVLELKPQLLKNSVPFFTPISMANKKMKPEIRIARAFENYWVNHSLCMKLSSLKSTAQIEEYSFNEIKKFETYGDPNYVKAIWELVNIMDNY